MIEKWALNSRLEHALTAILKIYCLRRYYALKMFLFFVQWPYHQSKYHYGVSRILVPHFALYQGSTRIDQYYIHLFGVISHHLRVVKMILYRSQNLPQILIPQILNMKGIEKKFWEILALRNFIQSKWEIFTIYCKPSR